MLFRSVAELDGREMREGDGLAIDETGLFNLTSTAGAEVLIFDLA